MPQNTTLTNEQRESFERDGYIILKSALPASFCKQAKRVISRLSGECKGATLNVTDIFPRDPFFLGFLDLPEVLPLVTDLLGWNIWVNTAHYNVNPPGGDVQVNDSHGYRWHRDSKRIHDDLGASTPRVSIKVAFYLTDLTEGQRGQTYVIPGSHNPRVPIPEAHEVPESAVRLFVPEGTVVLYDNRLIHSGLAPNHSDITRMAVFVQYAYRWLFPVSEMMTKGLSDDLTPIRRQLLGLSTNYYTVAKNAEGRSGRYFPIENETPLSYYRADHPTRAHPPFVRRLRQAMNVLLGRAKF